MSIIEFSEKEQEEIFNIVACVLHLGNIGFAEQEGHATISKDEPMKYICKVCIIFQRNLKKLTLFYAVKVLLSQGDTLKKI